MSKDSLPSGLPEICVDSTCPDGKSMGKLRKLEKEPIKSISELLEWEQLLRETYFGDRADDRLLEVWFRGTRGTHPLLPGIYRPEINAEIKAGKRDWLFGKSAEDESELCRLNLERDMMLTFEREAGVLFQHRSEQELYFMARHHGMPSRLLDWSSSPLIALFMCVHQEPSKNRSGRKNELGQESKTGQNGETGMIYAMDPEELPTGYICHQNDPKVANAVEVITTWEEPKYSPAILPIRPHTLAGRIDRQVSRFTLHSHGAQREKNWTLTRRTMEPECEAQIQAQLERLGIDEFAAYYTLDRLVSEIKRRFIGYRG
jgi:FRG domain